MASRASTSTPSIAGLLQELESLRLRLEQAAGGLQRTEDSLKAGALAGEVKRLCRESAESDSPAEIATLLARARRHLDELKTLLGSA